MTQLLIRRLASQAGAMLDLVADLVAIESPSADRDATARCAGVLLDAGKDLLGEPGETVVVDGTTHVRWRFGSGSGSGGYGVLLVGHLDTVWPTGTLARWPFAASADDDRATGPGAFDMKAGLVQLLFALATLDSLDGLTVLVTADEEIGSPSSRQLIVDEVTGKQAALVLEPGVGDALKTARKGVSNYEIEVVGRAAHAGLEPERGANATVELAHQVLRLTSLARPEIGTTVTPTVAAAGTTTNTVPAEARLQIDVRALTVDEQHRVDREIRSAAATVAGTTVRVGGGPNRPPLPATASAALMVRAKQVAAELGLAPLHGVEVGGGSDGNFTAGAGVPTLDGLGAVGGNAHAEGEFLVPSKLPERAALVAGLIDSLRAAPLPG